MPSLRPSSVVLALNVGSSSVKFGLYQVDDSSAVTLAYGEAKSVGEFTGKFTVQNAQGDTTISERLQFSSQSDAVARIVRYLVDALLPRPEAIGHRIVHGGTHCREHSLIDAETFYRLEQAAPFAPLHVPAALSGIRDRASTVSRISRTLHVSIPRFTAPCPISRVCCLCPRRCGQRASSVMGSTAYLANPSFASLELTCPSGW